MQQSCGSFSVRTYTQQTFRRVCVVQNEARLVIGGKVWMVAVITGVH